jgi:hypothetical protein
VIGQASDVVEDRPMLRRTLLAAGLAALALPTAASANATLTDTGSELVYQAEQGDVDSFTVYSSGGTVYFLPVSGGVRITSPSAGCGNPPPAPGTGAASCPLRDAVTLRLEDGNDFANVQSGPTVTFWGGAGDDRVFTVGSRLIAHGEAGNDSLQGGPGLDDLDGGPGDDILDPSSFGDVVRGGPGFDTARTPAPAGVVVTLDDVANDGVPGDNQNIRSDVEKVAAGTGGDELEGNALANTLSGGDGADTLTGNGGADTLLGDAGPDTINARDGVADDVNCGPGADTAVVDPLDTVTSCETVRLPDADADGVTAPQDCNDQNPAIHPGAVDVPGDGVDQDCTGADTAGPPPPPGPGPGPVVTLTGPGKVAAPIVNRWGLARRYTTVFELAVKEIPAGGRVEVRCTGKGCPFARRTLSPKGGSAKLGKLFKARHLKPGAVVEIRVTAPRMTGKVVRYTMRAKRKLPASTTLCLAPGASTPGAC